jgi:virginiamycin B lyase
MQVRHLIRSLLMLLFLVLTLGGATVASAAASMRATAGTITEYPIPTKSSYPQGITAGPDGNLWFAESNKDKIARITTDGTITSEFPVPGHRHQKSRPSGITAGPDGNLWFTELYGNRIGKITTH